MSDRRTPERAERDRVTGETSPWLDFPGLASYTTVGQSTLRALVRDGRGPKYKRIGQRYLFHKDAVDEWIKSRSEPADA